jgi:hypothetical protein
LVGYDPFIDARTLPFMSNARAHKLVYLVRSDSPIRMTFIDNIKVKMEKLRSYQENVGLRSDRHKKLKPLKICASGTHGLMKNCPTEILTF